MLYLWLLFVWLGGLSGISVSFPLPNGHAIATSQESFNHFLLSNLRKSSANKVPNSFKSKKKHVLKNKFKETQGLVDKDLARVVLQEIETESKSNLSETSHDKKDRFPAGCVSEENEGKSLSEKLGIEPDDEGEESNESESGQSAVATESESTNKESNESFKSKEGLMSEEKINDVGNENQTEDVYENSAQNESYSTEEKEREEGQEKMTGKTEIGSSSETGTKESSKFSSSSESVRENGLKEKVEEKKGNTEEQEEKEEQEEQEEQENMQEHENMQEQEDSSYNGESEVDNVKELEPQEVTQQGETDYVQRTQGQEAGGRFSGESRKEESSSSSYSSESSQQKNSQSVPESLETERQGQEREEIYDTGNIETSENLGSEVNRQEGIEQERYENQAQSTDRGNNISGDENTTFESEERKNEFGSEDSSKNIGIDVEEETTTDIEPSEYIPNTETESREGPSDQNSIGQQQSESQSSSSSSSFDSSRTTSSGSGSGSESDRVNDAETGSDIQNEGLEGDNANSNFDDVYNPTQDQEDNLEKPRQDSYERPPVPDPETITEEEPFRDYSDWQKEVLDLHNEYRRRHSVPPLIWNKKLSDYALRHGEQCVFENSGGMFIVSEL